MAIVCSNTNDNNNRNNGNNNDHNDGMSVMKPSLLLAATNHKHQHLKMIGNHNNFKINDFLSLHCNI